MVDVLAAGGVDPHRPGPHDEVHQVEEVAALLHERAAGVGREPVPVVDLRQERESVLADRQHPEGADRAVPHLVHQSAHRWHVAVLEADPHHRATALGRPQERAAVLDGRAQRLLDEHVESRVDGVEHRAHVEVVGRGDHDRIAQVGIEQRPVVAELGCRGPGLGRQGRTGRLERRRVGITDGADHGAVEGHQVLDVLDAHHPRADHAVADVVHRV